MDAADDPLGTEVAEKLDSRLKQHIFDVHLTALSRISTSRLKQSALPNIGLIELVSGATFAEKYDELYRAMFHGGERERSDLIVERLHQDFAGQRGGLFPYRIVGLRDHAGRAIAGAQFSVMLLPDGEQAIPYLQYIYVRPENRRQDLSELLHTLVLAVSMADAAAAVSTVTGARPTVQVPFTLFETEPPCHGADDAKRARAEERTRIHAKSGSLAMMLRKRSNGDLISSHVQPGLEPHEAPLTLVWVVRPNPGYDAVLDVQRMGSIVLAACYRSFRDEGFPEENIALAERMAVARCRDADFFLVPLADVTREMYTSID